MYIKDVHPRLPFETMRLSVRSDSRETNDNHAAGQVPRRRRRRRRRHHRR